MDLDLSGIGTALSSYFQGRATIASASSSKKATKLQIKSNEKLTTMQTLFNAGEEQQSELVNLLNYKKANRPIYTVPNVAPQSWVDKINWKIHAILTGSG
jgi:hypothetical protein